MDDSINNKIKPPVSLIERCCSVCGSQDAANIYDQPTEYIVGIGDIGYHHLINICKKCGFVFASPILSEDEILKYYERMSNYEHPESAGNRSIEDVRQIERQIEFIMSRFPSGFKGSALDVGCSIAYGLSLLKTLGWEVMGVDPSDKCIEISWEKLGVPVRKGFFSLELLEDQKPFDVIILSHVIEHLVYPDEVIRHLPGLLKDGGIIYIEVPNLMKPNSTKCYFGFEHVNFFTPQSLINLVCQNGFAIDRIETFDNGKEIHPFYPVIAMSAKKSGKNRQPIRNDYSESLQVIEEYKSSTGLLTRRINKKIQNILDKTRPGKLALWGGGNTHISIAKRNHSEIGRNRVHLR